MYLWWFDDSPKRSTADKIADAVQAYHERNVGQQPNVVCVWSDADIGETASGCAVSRQSYIRPGNVWVGYSPTGGVE